MAADLKPPANAPAAKTALTRETVFLQLTAHLQSNGIPHCLLGDTRGFPREIRSDVDFVVPAEALPRIPAVLSAFCAGRGIQIVQMLQHEPAASYFALAWPGPDGRACFLNPDFCSDFYHIGRRFLDAGELLAGHAPALDDAGQPRGFPVAPAATDFIYYLIKKLDKADLCRRSGSYLSGLWRKDPAAARKHLERFWSADEVKLLADAAEQDQWDPAIARVLQLQRSLRSRRPYSPGMLAREFARRARRFFQPTGLMVAVLGPDGGGKSSVIEQVLTSLAPAFRRTRCVHWRPGLAKKPAATTPTTDPHGQTPYGFVVSVIKLFYLWFDYTAGYFWKVYPRLARSTLVLFDRYYHDLLVDPHRYRFGGPRSLARLFGKLIPQPDLWILLDAPAEVLQQRKQEVPHAETARQREAYQRLVKEFPHSAIVDAAPALDQVVAGFEQAVLSFLAVRTRRRLGLPPDNP